MAVMPSDSRGFLSAHGDALRGREGWLGPLALLALCLAVSGCSCQKRGDPRGPRAPLAAGTFYPDDPAELAAEVGALLSDGAASRGEPARMVLAPHAAFSYSGKISAAAIRQLAPGLERVVILASSHGEHPAFDGISVERAFCYSMPGFEVPVDVEAADGLLGNARFVDVPQAHQSHVVEVLLPLIRAVSDRPFRILPLAFGRISRADARPIAERLAELSDGKTAFFFSIDLSHFHPYGEASTLDRACLDALVSMDADAVAGCETDATQVLLVMTELAALRGSTPALVAYANSGDGSDDRERVVGYGAIAYEDRFVLSGQERTALLALAREALEASVRDGEELEVTEELFQRFPRLGSERAAFVTLRRGAELRGCIGSLIPHRPLGEEVIANVVDASENDSRFEPVTASELPEIAVSISVLEAPKPLEGLGGEALVEFLRARRPGVILDFRGSRSTFLPEVWEQLPEPAVFLAELCRKQDSPDDCWRQAGARFETYGSQYFGEAPPSGVPGR